MSEILESQQEAVIETLKTHVDELREENERLRKENDRLREIVGDDYFGLLAARASDFLQKWFR